MEHYPYKNAAIFVDEQDARTVEQRINTVGFNNILLFVLAPSSQLISEDEVKLEPEGDEIRNTLVRDAVYGGAGGALTGAAASLAAGAFKLALFVSHPLMATLVALGYGTALGATGGAIVGENVKEDLFIGVLEDSLRQGQWVVITHAPDKETASKINVLLEHVHGANNIVNN